MGDFMKIFYEDIFISTINPSS